MCKVDQRKSVVKASGGDLHLVNDSCADAMCHPWAPLHQPGGQRAHCMVHALQKALCISLVIHPRLCPSLGFVLGGVD